MQDLTKKQAEFVKEFLDTGNGVQSALKAYDTDNYNSANQIAIENLQKPTIIEYLTSQADKVASNMVRLALNAERESDQISAGKDVLDRAGFKPVDKQETKLEVAIPDKQSDEKAKEVLQSYLSKVNG